MKSCGDIRWVTYCKPNHHAEIIQDLILGAQVREMKPLTQEGIRYISLSSSHNCLERQLFQSGVKYCKEQLGHEVSLHANYCKPVNSPAPCYQT